MKLPNLDIEGRRAPEASIPNAPLRQRMKRCAANVYRFFHPPPRVGELIILNYHSVAPGQPYSTPPNEFARQMEFLVERFEVVSLAEWCDRAPRRALSRPCAAITFDDGYENVFYYGYPVLMRQRLPATLFVSTGFIEGDPAVAARLGVYATLPPLTWAQLEAMSRNGVTIGSHTHSHVDLGTSSRTEIETELEKSKNLLEGHLGCSVRFFAYPWGQGRNLGVETSAALRRCGYVAACSTLWGRNGSTTDSYILRRIRIDPWDTITDFCAKLEGQWDFVRLYQVSIELLRGNFPR